MLEPCYKLDAEKATVMACGSGELLQLGIDIDTMISQRPRPVMHLSDTRIQWVCPSVCFIQNLTGLDCCWRRIQRRNCCQS